MLFLQAGYKCGIAMIKICRCEKFENKMSVIVVGSTLGFTVVAVEET